MFQMVESIDEFNMVTNVELAKEVGEKKERIRIIEEALKEKRQS